MSLPAKTFKLVGIRKDNARVTLCGGISTVQQATRAMKRVDRLKEYRRIQVEPDGPSLGCTVPPFDRPAP